MSTVEKILSSSESLSKEEFRRLRKWFYKRDWEKWEQEIGEYARAGKLVFLYNEAISEKKTGD